MKYIAHKAIINNIEKEQTLIEHLNNVAEKSSQFAIEPLKDVAYTAGLLHDLGKYTDEFQRRIRGSPIKTKHSIQGAIEVDKFVDKNSHLIAFILKYIIAGHHSGLPDGGAQADDIDGATLNSRLKYKGCDYSAYKSEIKTQICADRWLQTEVSRQTDKSKSIDENRKNIYELTAFFTRYIFSCLTDADFLDTEKFCNPTLERQLYGDFEKALKLLDDKLSTFSPDSNVKKARNDLLLQAQNNIKNLAQINLLNMPTGSGKTLTSLKVALESAKKEGKKRIIYVIPYTSITEQTAQVFRDILGDSVFILEHYSSFDYRKLKKNDDTSVTADKIKRATENWDAPIIITTTVQLFESLYHYKSSKLRKLHNLADSIIVLDEIHILPIENLQPCIRAISYITSYLNSKAIFLSATMPSYDEIFQKYAPKNSFRNLISDKTPYKFFKNQAIKSIGKISLEALAMNIPNDKSTLIVVNKKLTARELYKLVQGKKFHLTTNMTPFHRQKVLKEIKTCLKNGEKIIVISTSLIEAGVDLDFQTAYREIAGLDNILQTAGRCNREGNLKIGEVFVFEIDDEKIGTIRGEMQAKANITKKLLNEYDDISCDKCIEEYFNEIFGFNYNKMESNSIYEINGRIANPMNIPFRTYAQSFKMIKDETISIVINKNGVCDTILQNLAFGGYKAKRELQKYCVNVYDHTFADMLKSGLLSEVNGVFILLNNKYYSDEYGLAIDENHDDEYMFL